MNKLKKILAIGCCMSYKWLGEVGIFVFFVVCIVVGIFAAIGVLELVFKTEFEIFKIIYKF